jgi:hypothetical protein
MVGQFDNAYSTSLLSSGRHRTLLHITAPLIKSQGIFRHTAPNPVNPSAWLISSDERPPIQTRRLVCPRLDKAGSELVATTL